VTGWTAIGLESDDELRKRLAYVAADGQRQTHEILTATGQLLDDIAWRYGLRRRR
jgi:hypothetical protein